MKTLFWRAGSLWLSSSTLLHPNGYRITIFDHALEEQLGGYACIFKRFLNGCAGHVQTREGGAIGMKLVSIGLDYGSDDALSATNSDNRRTDAIAEMTSQLALVERVTGVEPAYLAWKANALPLSYTRKLRLTSSA